MIFAGFGARASAQELGDGWSLNATAATGYSSNPFLLRDRTSSAYAEFTATPRYSLITELAQSAVEGRFRFTNYTENLGTSSAYGLTALHSRRLSEQLTVNGELEFDHSIVGERREVLDISPLMPDPSQVPDDGLDFDPDASAEGLRQRRTMYRASGGLSLRLSELDSVSLDGELQRVAFPTTEALSSHWSQSVSSSYTRLLSPVSRIGGALTAQRYAYDDDRGSFTIITPQLVYQRRFGPLWTLDAAAGALLFYGRLPQGSIDSADVSANLSACRRGERTTLCVLAVRDATAGGLGGARKTSRAQLTYSYRLSDRQTINLSSGLASSAATSADVGSDEDNAKTTYGSVTYLRDVSTRLTASANVAYRTTSNAIVGDAGDVQARVSIGYNLGNRP